MAVNYSDDFLGSTLDPKWTYGVLLGTGSYSVSGSSLHLNADAGGSGVGVSILIDLPCNVFLRFSETGTPNIGAQSLLAVYKTNIMADGQGVLSINNALGTAIKLPGSIGATKNLSAEPFSFNLIIEADGVIVVRVKNASNNWEVCPAVHSPISFLGESDCYLTIGCINTSGSVYSNDIDWINNSDARPAPPVTDEKQQIFVLI